MRGPPRDLWSGAHMEVLNTLMASGRPVRPAFCVSGQEKQRDVFSVYDLEGNRVDISLQYPVI